METTKTVMEMEKIKVVMMPFLAHGHISTFFELAKRLSHTNLFQIYFLSTPICLEPIRNHQFDDDVYYTFSSDNTTNNNIELIDLEVVDDLPPHYLSTKNLPPHLFNSLLAALDSSKPAFVNLLEKLNPELVIFDLFQPWAGEVAGELDIHHVMFVPSYVARVLWPCPGAGKVSDAVILTVGGDDVVNGMTLRQRVLRAAAYSSNMVLVKSSGEIEGNFNEIVVLVGSAVQRPRLQPQPSCDNDQKVMKWLGEKEECSVVLVSLGSENFFSDEEMEEMARGLELSEVNFIWVVRFPANRNTIDVESFLDRTEGRGLILDWSPQVKVLTHKSVGGFVSHCGWSSTLESMYYGVPIIAVPIHVDQPYNANLAMDLGVGVQLKSYDQKLERENVANVVKRVMVDEEGKEMRKRAMELSQRLMETEDEEFNEAIVKIINLLRTKPHS